MPVKSGKSRKVISGNVEEMVNSSTFAQGQPRAKRIKMAVAAAMRTAGVRKLRKKAKAAKGRKDAGTVRHLAALGLAKGGR